MNRICRYHFYRIVCGCLLALLSWIPSPFVSETLALSIEDERKMGDEFMAQVLAQLQLVDDPFVNQYINDLGHYLITPLETKNFPFHFYVIKDNTLNAFAAPGGHIFVFSGLIEAMDTLDELAAVVCHEIGHISARHLAQRIEQSKTIGLATLAGILAGMFLGGDVAGAVMTGSIAAGMQAQLHYSREDERQADQLSYKYMVPTGFDPGGMIQALNKIQKGSWLGTGKIPAYLLTHPTGPERMANLEAMLSQYTPRPLTEEAALLKSWFPAFKTVITAKCLDPRDAERVFKRELKENPASPLPHFGLGMVYMEQSRYDRAIDELKQSLQGKPDFIPILRTLGEAYQMNGQDKEAEAVLEKVLKLDHGDKAALFLLGITYESAGRNREALRLFEKLSYLPPVRSDVFYHLGLLYGREKQLALAHYNFGVYFKRLGQPQKAQFHFKKAKELAGGDPALQKKIHKEMEDSGREKT
jgi:beta-barrel assembly-enhancing protease